MTRKCAICGQSTDEDFHSLCPEHYEELGIYGDEVLEKAYRALSDLAGAWKRIPSEHIKAIADSGVGTMIVTDLLAEKDHDTLIRMLHKVRKERGE